MNHFIYRDYEESPSMISRIANTQGDIYKVAYQAGYDIKEFSTQYLHSDFCRYEMDSAYSPYQTELAHICFNALTDEFKEKGIIIPQREEKMYESPYWVGNMYRRLFYELRISSESLSDVVSFDTLAAFSIDCEDMTEEEAVEYIAKQIKYTQTPNTIK